ncbi:hypothetical protein CRE_21723 [Caenorhabditis remanei]|uniref:Uncharacterized protein n=1 Tax=Caenorhabditis remanei TaxID=31234 RepID=E3MEH1_CAERE|nr:hypothetical protein CRE_21723 [Caenorhabditis remanei]
MKLQFFLLLVFVAIRVSSADNQDLQEVNGVQNLKTAIQEELKNIRGVVNASENEDQIETYTGLRVGILEDESSKLRELIKKLQSETAL